MQEVLNDANWEQVYLLDVVPLRVCIDYNPNIQSDSIPVVVNEHVVEKF
jgi:hypothetical protein